MSKAVLFYDAILAFVDASSTYKMHASLYDDLVNSTPPSPDSFKVLVKNHDGSLDVLRDKVHRAKNKRLNAWMALRRMMEACGVYDSVDAKVFDTMLNQRNEDSDFRTKVRDWSRAEMRKIDAKKADPDVVRPFRWYIDKYAELTLKREKKNLKGASSS